MTAVCVLLAVFALGCSDDAPQSDAWLAATEAAGEACVGTTSDGPRTWFSSSCALAVVDLEDGGFRIGYIAKVDESLGRSIEAIEAAGEATDCFGPSEVARMQLARPGDAEVTVGRATWAFNANDDDTLFIVCA